ncbi:hypothetical protein KAR91_50105 [Candidatus Pacearchaeota archaeon]|nr:hypothetical protein [Candidatus Pacearchaeota archaeon]
MAKTTKGDSGNPFLRGGVSDTVYRKAKAWDGILAGNDMNAVVEQPQDSVFRKAAAFSNLDHRKVSFDGTTQLNGTNDETETKHRIASCREAYENVGIIGNIVDIMIDFALEDLEIEHTNRQVERFFKKWMRTAKVFEVSEQILKGLYRDGNVPILSFFGELNDEEVRRMRRLAASVKKHAKSQIIDSEIQVKNVIPFRYEMLDVLRMFRTGSELLGTIGWEYQFDAEDLGFRGIRTQESQSADTADALSKFEDQIGTEATKQFAQNGRIILPKSKIHMLYYKRDGYRSWATPLLWRVIPDVKFKKLIRDMDISVAEGVTNALTIVKLGAIEKGLPPSKKKFQKVTAMLRTPQKSKTIIWDNLISVETVFPPVEKFFSDKKYKQADADIRAGLGIPEALVNGQGSNFSNSFLAIKTLMERLETGRKIVQTFWTDQASIVTRNMGFRKVPIVRLGKMSLTDEEVEKRFMIELFDRNAISFETLLSRFGENISIEIERIRREDAERKELEDKSDYALLRVGKFSGTIPQLLGEESSSGNQPSEQGKEGPKGGRPPATKKKQQQQTQPDAPQGQKTAANRRICSIIPEEKINTGFDKLYKIVATTIAKGNNYSNLRELTDEDRIQVANSIGQALPKLIHEKRWTSELVKNALKSESGIKLERCVASVTKDEVAKFRKRHDKAPNKKAMRTITQKAFKICNASVKDD